MNIKIHGTPTGQTDAFGNQYILGDDGEYYKTDGTTVWETAETKRRREAREKAKIERSTPASSGASYGQIYDAGIQQLEEIVADEFKTTGKMIVKGAGSAAAALIRKIRKK